MLTNEFIFDLRLKIRSMAHELVWLEEWAHHAYVQRNFVRVGELTREREEVQEHRSRLMRELWSATGGKRVREALRQA